MSRLLQPFRSHWCGILILKRRQRPLRSGEDWPVAQKDPIWIYLSHVHHIHIFLPERSHENLKGYDSMILTPWPPHLVQVLFFHAEQSWKQSFVRAPKTVWFVRWVLPFWCIWSISSAVKPWRPWSLAASCQESMMSWIAKKRVPAAISDHRWWKLGEDSVSSNFFGFSGFDTGIRADGAMQICTFYLDHLDFIDAIQADMTSRNSQLATKFLAAFCSFVHVKTDSTLPSSSTAVPGEVLSAGNRSRKWIGAVLR